MEQALDNPDLKIYGPAGSYLEQLLKNSRLQIYQRLWKRLNKFPDSFYYDVDEASLVEHSKELISENVASMLTDKEAEIVVRAANKLKPNLYIAKEPVLTYYSRMVMKKTFPCPDLLNAQIKRLAETGMLPTSFC